MLEVAPMFGLTRDAWGRLVLIDREGVRHIGVQVARAYPLSDPQHGISVRNSEGQELYWIHDLADLPEATRRTIEAELAQGEFMPTLVRLIRVPPNTEPCQWDVETDRGPTTFILNTEDDVRRLGPYKALIVDSQGTRYLVPDTRQLDRLSRFVLERYF